MALSGSSTDFISKPATPSNVMTFGAVGNGVTDDSNILGNIVAPQKKSEWKSSNVDTWIAFERINGLIVNGHGKIDGRGQAWWTEGNLNTSFESKGTIVGSPRPTALHFFQCNNLQVDGLNHINSQRNHISITNCNGATISNLHISAPETSPNTDGIDISGSTNIQILHCNIGTGDDCIAIIGGSSFINISNIACGPGHGISIGSLGENGKSDQVEEVHVKDSSFTATKNGVRIKTWQSSAVKISDVSYTRVQGTSINAAAITLNCSHTVPCTNIILDHVNITSTDPKQPTHADCINAHGSSIATFPPVGCLLK
ncbi:hypothetical protein F0562_023056 [Nyssa sinensis]|uniref:Polygalacturonase n=1 Tax=Nyssa sinensis TaxID=561372 RepID=A0A5J5BGV5_9ASTE|nr:hypothetical protein F0562_023056 [Nyssa sinensis]